jgi:Ca-activated chloride channel family protein
MLLVIPVVVTGRKNYRQGKVSLKRLTGFAGGEWFFVRSFLFCLFFACFIVFASLALAGISWGREPVQEDLEGLDVMFVMDVSRSMLAQDVSPTRLRAASDMALALTRSFSRARFGVVVFKGRAVRAVPLTEDREILENFFRQISPALVREPGTSIEAGLEEALRSFPKETAGRGRVIALFSDGESLSDFSGFSPEKAASGGIPVFAVGMGSSSGAVIRLSGGETVMGRDGQAVVSRLNAEALVSAARISGGEYFSSQDPGVLSSLADALADFEEERGRRGFRLSPVKRFRSFLFAGFVLVCMSILVRSLPWKKRK